MSLKLLLDEDISPRVAVNLRHLGYDTIHLRDVGMKGSKDSQVIAYARDSGRCLVTLDADFADIRSYPPGSHYGIIRLRLKFAPSSAIITSLSSLLTRLIQIPMEKGVLVVSDGHRYRIRFPKESQ